MVGAKVCKSVDDKLHGGRDNEHSIQPKSLYDIDILYTYTPDIL